MRVGLHQLLGAWTRWHVVAQLRGVPRLLGMPSPQKRRPQGVPGTPFHSDGQEWQVGAFRLAPDCRLPRDNLAGVRLLQVGAES